MNGLKKFGLVVSLFLFTPLFMLSVASYTFNQTLADEEYVKQTIDETGFYVSVGEAVVAQATGEAGSDPLIAAALNSAASGDNIQQSLEPLIDGTYGWLAGETPQPQFNLAIEPLKANFQNSLTKELKNRAAGLPTCTSASQVSGEDIFTYSCIPPGTDVNAAINDAVLQVTNSASVFSDEVVADGTVSTAEAQQLGINDPTQNLPETLPRLYLFMTKGQWFFIAGTVLAAIGVILLSRTWLYGLRKFGVLLVVNGLGTLFLGLIMSWVVSTLVPTTAVESTEATVNALEQASKVILSDNAGMLKLIGLITSVLGVMSIIVSSILISKNKTEPPKKTPTTPASAPVAATLPKASKTTK